MGNLKHVKGLMLMVARCDQPEYEREVFVKRLACIECSTLNLLTLNAEPQFEISQVYGMYICLYSYDEHIHQLTAMSCDFALFSANYRQIARQFGLNL